MATVEKKVVGKGVNEREDQPAVVGCAVTVTVTNDVAAHTFSFVLGESQVQPWIEEAVTGQCHGASVVVASHGTVTLDRVTVPRDALGSSPSKDEFLSRAEELRLEGNAIFKESTNDFKSYKRAMLKYQLALDMVRRAGGDEAFQIKLRNNLALCCLRTCDWTAAILQCDSVLELDPMSAKAYYRRALAEVELDMFVRALADLREAHQISPDDPAIAKELKRVERESRKTLQKRRHQFAEVYNVMPQSCVFEDIIPA